MNLDWLAKIAPTVASALGGPLAGLAVTAVGAAFGWDDATQEKITETLQSGTLSGEQVAALKIAELEMQKQEKELGFKFAELEFKKLEMDSKDRDSARSREASVKDPTNRVLAFLIIGGFLTLTGSTLMGYTSVDSALAGTLVGYLSAKAEQVLSYYFGSTSGSLAKTQLMVRGAAK